MTSHVAALLPAYLNGTLAASGAASPAELELHLAECSACQAELAAWRAIAGATRAYVATEIAAGSVTRANPYPVIPSEVEGSRTTRNLSRPIIPRTPLPPPRTGTGMARSAGVRAALSAAARIIYPEGMPDERRPLTLRTFALVLLVVVAAVGFDAWQSDDDHPAMLPALSTPAPIRVLAPNEAIRMSECSTQPRPPLTAVNMLRDHPELVAEIDLYGYPYQPQDPGVPVSDDEFMAIEAGLRQLVACSFYAVRIDPDRGTLDYDGRYFALFSDAYLVSWLNAEMKNTVDSAPPIPFGTVPMRLEQARRLTDGRIVARVIGSGVDDDTVSEIVLVRQQGGIWLVDDWVWPPDLQQPSTNATPVAWDHSDDFTILLPEAPYTVSIVTTFCADHEIQITIVNRMDLPMKYKNEDFDFVVEIPAGDSRDFVIDAPPGEYTFKNSIYNQPDLVITIVGPGTPMPPDIFNNTHVC